MSGRILVVDDSPTMALRAKLILAKRGHTVRTMQEPNDVPSSLASDPVDLIILDVEMPGVTGYQLCDRLKSEAATESIPILFLTSRDDYLDKLKGYAVGAQGYLTKDYQEDELARAVELLLAGESIE